MLCPALPELFVSACSTPLWGAGLPAAVPPVARSRSATHQDDQITHQLGEVETIPLNQPTVRVITPTCSTAGVANPGSFIATAGFASGTPSPSGRWGLPKGARWVVTTITARSPLVSGAILAAETETRLQVWHRCLSPEGRGDSATSQCVKVNTYPLVHGVP